MRVNRGSNKPAQEQGIRAKEAVFDQTSYQLFKDMYQELQMIRTILANMADLNVDEFDKEELL